MTLSDLHDTKRFISNRFASSFLALFFFLFPIFFTLKFMLADVKVISVTSVSQTAAYTQNLTAKVSHASTERILLQGMAEGAQSGF